MMKIILLTKTQVSSFRKSFSNGSSANIKLSKIQLHKIGQSGRFLGRLLGSLLKTGLPLTINLLKKSFNTIRINSCSISNRRGYSKENLWIRNYSINNFKR